MELKDPETPKKPCTVNLRVLPLLLLTSWLATPDAINIFGKLGVKEKLDEKLKSK